MCAKKSELIFKVWVFIFFIYWYANVGVCVIKWLLFNANSAIFSAISWREQVNYVPQTKFGRQIVFAPFLIIITSPRLLLGDVLLFCVSFSLLLLRLPDCCRVTYCYSMFLFHYYYYVSPSNEGRHIVLVWFFLLPLLLLLSVTCPDHNFFVFPYRSIIFGMWVHDHKAVCRVP